MSKNGAYPSKHIRLHEIIHEENYLPLEKMLYHYTNVSLKKQATRVAILLIAKPTNLPAETL